MPSEARRGFVRIVSNYVRVVTLIVLGLAVVPILLRATGDDGWALISLLGATVGVATVVQETVRSSLIRELAAAYHSGSDEHFRNVYNSGLSISAVTAVLAVPLFAALWLALPVFEIPPELLPAGRWLVASRGANAVAILVLAAPFNMYKVTERMVAHNLWGIANRCCFVAAAVLILFLDFDDAGGAVTAYALISVCLAIGTLTLAVFLVMWRDRRLIPSLGKVSREAVKSILHVGSWNAAAIVSTTLHHRIGHIIMNLAFGLWGNLLFGLASQLTVAVRRLAVGMTDGLDAVSTRLSSTRTDHAVRTLVHHSTRLHGLVTFPVAVGVLMLADPVLRLWVGGRVDDPAATIPQAVTLVRIMAIGMVARAISDGWIRILYGAGHVRRYAPWILAGGIANPLTALLLLWILPEPARYTAVCWAFSVALLAVHGFVVAGVGARALNVGYGEMFLPLWRPLVVALVCAPILLLVREPSLLLLVAAVGTYCVFYAAGTVIFVMTGAERVRFGRAALRHLPALGKTSGSDLRS